jgi:integrase
MPSLKLTKMVVEAEQPGPIDRFLWDTSLRGFGVKVTPKGAKVYVAQFRPKGSRKSRRYTIGRHASPWTTDMARTEASKLLARAQLGEDPFQTARAKRREEEALALAEKAAVRAAKAAKARSKTHAFSTVVELFIERYAKPRNRSWAETQHILTSKDLDPWKQRQIDTITPKEVLALIDKVSDRKVSARLLFAHLRKFFSWCVGRLLIDVSPCLGLKGPPIPRPRDRWLSDEELRLVWLASHDLEWPFGPLLRLLILTGQRRQEVAGMHWSELDLGRAEWTIPAARAKNGKAHLVDLSPAAVEILSTKNYREGLVFTTTTTTPVSGHSKAKRHLDLAIVALRRREAAEQGRPEPISEIPKWRVHDLRRTAATGMSRLGHPPYVVEAVLNHISGSRGGLVAVYQHYDHRAERRAALLAWAEHVRSIVGDGPSRAPANDPYPATDADLSPNDAASLGSAP